MCGKFLHRKGYEMASLYRRDGVYYVKFYDNGKRVRRSLATSSRVQALKLKEHIERDLANGKFIVERKDSSIEMFWEEYLSWAENHKRPATIAGERIFWRQFVDFAKPKVLGDITQNDVERFKKKRIHDGLKPKSINDALTALRAILNHARKLGFFNGPNPFVGVERLRIPRNPPKYLQKDQVEQLLMVSRKQGREIHLVVALGVYAGLRKNEIANARWEWFDFKGKLITLTSGDDFELKDSESRTIPLHDRLAKILLPYRQEVGFLFAPDKDKPGKNRYRYEFKTAFNTLLKKTGLTWVTPHTLRHTFASQLAMAGVSLYKISKWLGHSDVKTTQVYAHLQTHDEDINRF